MKFERYKPKRNIKGAVGIILLIIAVVGMLCFVLYTTQLLF